MRVHTVKKSRKEFRCGRCGALIRPGSMYYFFEPRFGTRQVRCTLHYPKPSEMTSSEKLSELYGAREAVEEALETARTNTSLDLGNDEEPATSLEDLASELSTAADTARDVAEQYEEGASNMEQYFPDSPRVDEIRDKSSECEGWADSLEEAQNSVNSAISDIEALFSEDLPPDDDPDFEEAREKALEERRERAGEILDPVFDEVENVLSELSL